MANSYDPQGHRRVYHTRKVAARTPGSLGRNDHGDPFVCSHRGDSPGSLGANDHAAEVANAEKRSAVDPNKTLKLMLLDKKRLAGFLRSVIYLQLTSDMIKLKTERMGLVFKTTEVDTGDERQKDKRVQELLPDYMGKFVEASSHGAGAAIEFLLEAEQAKSTAQRHIREVIAQATSASEETTKTIGTTIKGLKTVEYGAGGALTVMGLFVGAAGALAAGIIGFSYDTVTDALDNYREHGKGSVDADVVALVSEDTAKNTGIAMTKEIGKGKLAGKEIEQIEKLEKDVEYLEGKITVKQGMIAKSKSLRYSNKIGRQMAKDERALAAAEGSIKRFKGVNVLFAAEDLAEKGYKIFKVWTEPE